MLLPPRQSPMVKHRSVKSCRRRCSMVWRRKIFYCDGTLRHRSWRAARNDIGGFCCPVTNFIGHPFCCHDAVVALHFGPAAGHTRSKGRACVSWRGVPKTSTSTRSVCGLLFDTSEGRWGLYVPVTEVILLQASGPILYTPRVSRLNILLPMR